MIQKDKWQSLLLGVFLSQNLIADTFDVDKLLNNIDKKTDLSEKTKLENGGISYIYTREDLRKMQAHNLKNILDLIYPFGYNENNFGLSDPYNLGIPIPYFSSSLKIYIDNQEITTGMYGSGLIIYGNMDIDFVDHIEVYSGNPTFKYSTEPAFTIIKLYSKVAQKDAGSKIAVSGGSRGTNRVMGYNTDELDNGWSYLAYINHTDNKRIKYHNEGATLSRDIKTTHLFSSLYKENDKIIVDAIASSRDAFLGPSLFATPQENTLDNKYLHIGYDTKKGNLSFLLSFDMSDTKNDFEDLNKRTIQGINSLYDEHLPYSVHSNSKAEVYTTGLNYNIDTNANRLLIGAKYRFKHFKYDTININNLPLPKSGHSQQITTTEFAENQYFLANNKVITTGFSYSQVRNNHSNQDDDLLRYRFGYTYTNKNLISKTIASHLETTIDPYLVHSIYIEDKKGKIEPQKINIFMQDIKYQYNSNKYEMLLNYTVAKNRLFPNQTTGLLEAYTQNIILKSLLGRYTKTYNQYDKLEITLSTNSLSNIPQINSMQEYSSNMEFFNSYKKFDFFNGVLFYRNDNEKKSYYNYNLGIIYHQTEDLTFSIQGTNILNRAYKASYTRLNINTLEANRAIKISPIDRKIVATVEYLF